VFYLHVSTPSAPKRGNQSRKPPPCNFCSNYIANYCISKKLKCKHVFCLGFPVSGTEGAGCLYLNSPPDVMVIVAEPPHAKQPTRLLVLNSPPILGGAALEVVKAARLLNPLRRRGFRWGGCFVLASPSGTGGAAFTPQMCQPISVLKQTQLIHYQQTVSKFCVNPFVKITAQIHCAVTA
jgi:hypothetical protein